MLLFAFDAFFHRRLTQTDADCKKMLRISLPNKIQPGGAALLKQQSLREASASLLL
jgi:hypothetical protein